MAIDDLNKPKPVDPNTDVSLDDWDIKVSEHYKVPHTLMRAMAKQESAGSGDTAAVSPTGVKGRYQVTQKVAKGYGLDRDDPFQQSVAAAKYLREQYDALKDLKDDDERWLGAVGRYYGGSGAVKGGTLSGETVDQVSNPAAHVEKVAKNWGTIRKGTTTASPVVQSEEERIRQSIRETKAGLKKTDLKPGQTLELGTGKVKQIVATPKPMGQAQKLPTKPLSKRQQAIEQAREEAIGEARQLSQQRQASLDPQGSTLGRIGDVAQRFMLGAGGEVAGGLAGLASLGRRFGGQSLKDYFTGAPAPDTSTQGDTEAKLSVLSDYLRAAAQPTAETSGVTSAGGLGSLYGTLALGSGPGAAANRAIPAGGVLPTAGRGALSGGTTMGLMSAGTPDSNLELGKKVGIGALTGAAGDVAGMAATPALSRIPSALARVGANIVTRGTAAGSANVAQEALLGNPNAVSLETFLPGAVLGNLGDPRIQGRARPPVVEAPQTLRQQAEADPLWQIGRLRIEGKQDTPEFTTLVTQVAAETGNQPQQIVAQGFRYWRQLKPQLEAEARQAFGAPSFGELLAPSSLRLPGGGRIINRQRGIAEAGKPAVAPPAAEVVPTPKVAPSAPEQLITPQVEPIRANLEAELASKPLTERERTAEQIRQTFEGIERRRGQQADTGERRREGELPAIRPASEAPAIESQPDVVAENRAVTAQRVADLYAGPERRGKQVPIETERRQVVQPEKPVSLEPTGEGKPLRGSALSLEEIQRRAAEGTYGEVLGGQRPAKPAEQLLPPQSEVPAKTAETPISEPAKTPAATRTWDSLTSSEKAQAIALDNAIKMRGGKDRGAYLAAQKQEVQENYRLYQESRTQRKPVTMKQASEVRGEGEAPSAESSVRTIVEKAKAERLQSTAPKPGEQVIIPSREAQTTKQLRDLGYSDKDIKILRDTDGVEDILAGSIRKGGSRQEEGQPTPAVQPEQAQEFKKAPVQQKRKFVSQELGDVVLAEDQSGIPGGKEKGGKQLVRVIDTTGATHIVAKGKLKAGGSPHGGLARDMVAAFTAPESTLRKDFLTTLPKTSGNIVENLRADVSKRFGVDSIGDVTPEQWRTWAQEKGIPDSHLPESLGGSLRKPPPEVIAAREVVENGKNLRRSGGPTTEELKAYATIGAYHLGRGIKVGKAWAREMVKEFGNTIRPYLARIRAAANEFLKSETGSAPASPKPGKGFSTKSPAEIIAEARAAAGVTASKKIPAKGSPENPDGILKTVWKEAWGGVVATKLGLDFSAPGRQGAILSVSHPFLAARAFGTQMKSFFSSKNYEAHKRNLQSHVRYEQAKKSGLALGVEETAEQFQAKWAKKIPALGQAIKAGERAMNSYLDSLRMDVFEQQAKRLSKWGQNNPQAMKDLAEFINISTGVGNPDQIGKVAGTILRGTALAPKFQASRAQILATPVTMWKKNPAVRRIMAEHLAAFAGTLGLIYAGASFAGAKVGKDPRGPDFLQITLPDGETKYDLTAGLGSWAKFGLVLAAGGYERLTELQKPKEERQAPEYDVMQATESFIRNRMAPALSLGYDFYKGEVMEREEATGKKKPFTMTNVLKSQIMPLLAEDFLEAVEKEGSKKGIVKALPAAVGVGYQRYSQESGRIDLPKNSEIDRAHRALLHKPPARITRGEDESFESYSDRVKAVRQAYEQEGANLVKLPAFKDAPQDVRKKALEIFHQKATFWAGEKEREDREVIHPEVVLEGAIRNVEGAPERLQRRRERRRYVAPPR